MMAKDLHKVLTCLDWTVIRNGFTIRLKNTNQELFKSLELECRNRRSGRPVLCDIQHEYKVKTLCGSRQQIYLFSIMQLFGLGQKFAIMWPISNINWL